MFIPGHLNGDQFLDFPPSFWMKLTFDGPPTFGVTPKFKTTTFGFDSTFGTSGVVGKNGSEVQANDGNYVSFASQTSWLIGSNFDYAVKTVFNSIHDVYILFVF